ncbi:NmrA/HSCARG family protein [Paenibacillus sp. FSL R10-2736]|uniref:NmrA/HSCARG family protein n=1 Tax=Paenibacillus sp. FSL R10-2736 TaxID=2954692 RepID=UPI0030F6344F
MERSINNEGSSSLILVIGATGTQGGKVARVLLAHGHRVRILTRHPGAPAAQRLVEAGAEAVRGDMGDPASLTEALRGVTGVFSMSPLDGSGDDSEKRYASALVVAALNAGAGQFVHASVAGIEQPPYHHVPDSLVHYWQDKWEIEEYVRNAGFPSWTILQPTWVMENLAEPTSRFMFPQLNQGKLFTALKTDTRLDMVAADDIGAFACAAFENPAAFSGKNIALAGESLTMGEVAAALSRATGQQVTSSSLRPAEAIAQGMHPSVVNSQAYRNEVGFLVDIGALKQYGIPLTTFAQWADKYRSKIAIGS